jgi:hypothetical protein
MTYLTSNQYQPYSLRKQLVSGYATLIQEIIEGEDAEAYFVNFMFHPLPGKEGTKIEIMTNEVIRFHGLLKMKRVASPAPKPNTSIPVRYRAINCGTVASTRPPTASFSLSATLPKVT